MDNSHQPIRRRWFRFSLRTLLVVITLFCTWLAWQMEGIRARRRFVASIETKYGDGMIYENDSDISEYFARHGRKGADDEVDRRPWRFNIPWYRRLLGDRPMLILHVPAVSKQEAEALFPEASIHAFAPD